MLMHLRIISSPNHEKLHAVIVFWFRKQRKSCFFYMIYDIEEKGKLYLRLCLCGCNNLPRYQMSSTPTKYDINYQDNLLKACNDVMQ